MHVEVDAGLQRDMTAQEQAKRMWKQEGGRGIFYFGLQQCVSSDRCMGWPLNDVDTGGVERCVQRVGGIQSNLSGLS